MKTIFLLSLKLKKIESFRKTFVSAEKKIKSLSPLYIAFLLTTMESGKKK